MRMIYPKTENIIVCSGDIELILLVRGPNNSIFSYSIEQFRDLLEEVSKNITKDGLNYPDLCNHLAQGVYLVKSNKDGEVVLPQFLMDHLDPEGEIYTEERSGWIVIKKKHENECFCDNTSCAKCVRGNCKNDHCSTHKLKDKTRFR